MGGRVLVLMKIHVATTLGTAPFYLFLIPILGEVNSVVTSVP